MAARGAATGPERPRLWNAWGWRILAAQLGVMLGVFTLFRLAFLLLYWPRFAETSPGAIAFALLHGLRFDLAVVLGVGGLPMLLTLLAGPWRVRRAAGWLAFALLAAATVVMGVLMGIDLFYYEYVNRRVSFEILAMTHEVRAIAAVMVAGYLWQTVGILAALALLVLLAAWFHARLLRRPAGRVRWWSQALQVAAFVLLAALGVRGGWQTKPLSTAMAFRSTDMAQGHLTLNAVFTAVQALDRRRPHTTAYFSDEQAMAYLRQAVPLPDPPFDPRYPLLRERRDEAPPNRRNIVLIVLESFSPRFTAALGGLAEVMPHFNRLAREGLLFDNFYAVGTRSIQGIATILTGYPNLPGITLTGSALDQHVLSGLPQLLQAQGYSTFFLHGAFRGSMGFDAFARRVGFGRFIAQEDFADYAAVSDGAWGIFDGPALARLHQELQAAPKPVLGFFFSLSSHTPYTLPAEFHGPFGDDVPNHDMLNSFAYTDAALGAFFEQARQADYWRNTVFMVTADHNIGKGAPNDKARMWIPLLILNPGDADFPRGRVSSVLGSQQDLASTVLDLLHVSVWHSLLGQSLFAPARRPYVFMSWGDVAGWMSERTFLEHDLTKPLAFFDYRDDPDLQHNLLQERPAAPPPPEVNLLLGYLQTANNLLLENRVSPGARQLLHP